MVRGSCIAPADSNANANANTPASPTCTSLDFNRIFVDHFPYLWSRLRRLGVHDLDLEDVAHEVFLRVHAQLPHRDPERPIGPWIFGIAIGMAANYRRLSRHRTLLQANPPDLVDARPTADDHLMQTERSALVQRALEQVALPQRAVLILHDMDEVPIPEAAVALGIGINTAYSRLRLGRDAFRRALEQIADGGGSK